MKLLKYIYKETRIGKIFVILKIIISQNFSPNFLQNQAELDNEEIWFSKGNWQISRESHIPGGETTWGSLRRACICWRTLSKCLVSTLPLLRSFNRASRILRTRLPGCWELALGKSNVFWKNKASKVFRFVERTR